MLANISEYIVSIFKFMRIQDILDILIVAYVIYHGIRLMRETRAVQLIKGIVILLVVLQLSVWLNLHMINYILKNAMQVGVLALIIVFQPELRRALEQMGRSQKINKVFNLDDNTEVTFYQNIVDQICTASENLSQTHTGALMVLERQTKIGDIIRTGVSIDSNLSAELLVNIFVPNTPLHDGAVVIRGDRIIAAACFLPLTQNADLALELGTRHRAALGITENSDALVVVVSEETGKISLAMEGSLTRNLTVDSLQKALMKFLSPEDKPGPRRKLFAWKGMKS